MRQKTNSPSLAQRQSTGGAIKSKFLSVVLLCFATIVSMSAFAQLPRVNFIPMKPEFRQIRSSGIPVIGGIGSGTADLAYPTQDLPALLPSNQKQMLKDCSQRALKGDRAGLKLKWNALIQSFGNQTAPVDLDELIYAVLRPVLMARAPSVSLALTKAHFARAAVAEHQAALLSLRLQQQSCSSNSPVCSPETVQGLAAEIKALEDKLLSVGNDAQLADVDLQNILQKEQQTLQMMSDISKELYDTAMSVIRHIGS
jgi:hypothetical protein